jgi:hypothetical protein
MTKAGTLKAFRLIHLYIGVFITPALLFFAFTGALQTFGLHESSAEHPGPPPKWIVTLAQIHKKQTAIVPQRKPAAPPKDSAAAPKPGTGGDDHGKADSAPTAPKPAPAPKHNKFPLQMFFALVCWGLFFSTLTGLYMTYNYVRNKLLVTAVLLAGIVIPPLLLLIQ